MNDEELQKIIDDAEMSVDEIMEVLEKGDFLKTPVPAGECDRVCAEGEDYLYGRGVEQSYPEAYRLFTKAMEMGSPKATYLAAYCTFNGWGTGRSYEKSFELMMEAALKGQPDAEYELGRMYLSGLGIGRDVDEAVKWIRRSSDHNNCRAMKLLSELIDSGTAEPRSDDESTVLSVLYEILSD